MQYRRNNSLPLRSAHTHFRLFVSFVGFHAFGSVPVLYHSHPVNMFIV